MEYKAGEEGVVWVKEQIYKEDAVDALKQQAETMSEWSNRYAEQRKGVLTAVNVVKDLPTVQPEPISDAYARAVLTWLIDYQIKAAELHGRYTPYEVLSWVINDWRKENEGTDRKASGD